MQQMWCPSCGGELDSGFNCLKGCNQSTQSYKRPHACPVCNGSGQVSKPSWVPGDVTQWMTDGSLYSCKACKETGIVWEII